MVKNPLANAEDARDAGSDPWVEKNPLEEEMQPAPVFLPGKSLVQRSMATHFPFLPSFTPSLFPLILSSFCIFLFILFLFLSCFFSSPSHVKVVTSNIYLSVRRGQPLILLNTLWVMCHLTKVFFL